MSKEEEKINERFFMFCSFVFLDYYGKTIKFTFYKQLMRSSDYSIAT